MPWGDCVDKTTNVPTLRCIPIVINNVVYGALALSGIAATILIIISGIKFLLSNGDQLKVEQARKTMTFAIIGLVIILLSFFLINVIAKITGASCILKFLGCR